MGLRRGLEHVRHVLAEFLHLGINDHEAIRLVRVASVELLMVALGGVERVEGRELGHDGVFPQPGSVRFLLRFLGARPLLVVVVEDYRAVLRADVGPLAVQRGGVVGAPEYLEQVVEGNDGGVKGNLDGFRMTGRARANLSIGRIFRVAAGIAGYHATHAFDVQKHRLGAPETPGSKRCRRQRI